MNKEHGQEWIVWQLHQGSQLEGDIDLDEESSQAETVIKMTLNNYYTAGY